MHSAWAALRQEMQWLESSVFWGLWTMAIRVVGLQLSPLQLCGPKAHKVSCMQSLGLSLPMLSLLNVLHTSYLESTVHCNTNQHW